MITMALAAFGPVVLIECMFVFAAVEQTGVGRVTKTATSAHLRDPGRTGSMVAVAGVACGRAQIATVEQRVAMHACAIFRKLRRRKRRSICACEAGHYFRIGVARATSLRHPLPVHHRLWIFRRANPMKTMATYARWCPVVVFFQQCPPMRAILELCQLIGR